MDHFNKLTPGEAERLAYLIEECSEVIQAATKILRHGYFSSNPVHNPHNTTNRGDLSRELGDVARAVQRMIDEGDINHTIYLHQSQKPFPIQYMHHQGEED